MRMPNHSADHGATMTRAQFDAANDRIDALCGKLSFTPEEAEEYFRLKEAVAAAVCSQGKVNGKLGADAPDHGRKGGSAGSAVAETPSVYIGIDYGMGMSNVDHASGIHYGVISQHSLCQEALSDMEPDYGDPSCPDCGGSVLEADEVKNPALWKARSQYAFDYACLKCRKGYPAMFMDAEPIGMEYSGDGYELVDCLDTDVMVLKSPYYTHAQLCSPCVPGAGNLDCPMAEGVKTYALGHDWFDGGVAPYPVFRVEDGSVVLANTEEGEEEAS